MGDERGEEKGSLVLVARKGCFGLPTACPSCLPVYVYLRLANASFDLNFDVSNPDSDHVPYVEFGDYVAFNNEKGGVIDCLTEDSIVDLDSKLPSLSVPEWVSTKAMISTWLAQAVQYELWVASDGSIANKIYFSDLPRPIGKILHWKQTRAVKQLCGITSLNAAEKEAEIYKKANMAYDALSTRLGAQEFLFDNRPTSVDAIFLGHALFVLHALLDTSVLRNSLLKHTNLVKYAEYLKTDLLEASSSSSSSIPRSPFDASTSSMPRKSASSRWRSEPKPKAKRERTEEEKNFQEKSQVLPCNTACCGYCILVTVWRG